MEGDKELRELHKAMLEIDPTLPRRGQGGGQKQREYEAEEGELQHRASRAAASAEPRSLVTLHSRLGRFLIPLVFFFPRNLLPCLYAGRCRVLENS